MRSSRTLIETTLWIVALCVALSGPIDSVAEPSDDAPPPADGASLPDNPLADGAASPSTQRWGRFEVGLPSRGDWRVLELNFGGPRRDGEGALSATEGRSRVLLFLERPEEGVSERAQVVVSLIEHEALNIDDELLTLEDAVRTYLKQLLLKVTGESVGTLRAVDCPDGAGLRGVSGRLSSGGEVRACAAWVPSQAAMMIAVTWRRDGTLSPASRDALTEITAHARLHKAR